MPDRARDFGDDPLLTAIVGLIDSSPWTWTGTAGELLATLDKATPGAARRANWPTSAMALGHRLTAIGPALADAGVGLARAREGHDNRRMIRLTRQVTLPGLKRAATEQGPDDEKALGWPTWGDPAAGERLGFIGVFGAAAVSLLLIWGIRRLFPGTPAAT